MNENVNNFEKLILDNKNTPEIKYSIDRNIESSVKYEYLCESFGKEKADSAIKESGFDLLDLYDIDNFNIIVEILNTPSI
jgi:hypothetical protein